VTLEQFLINKRAVILSKWFDLILETYPGYTAAFLRREKDRFLNPVGYTSYQSVCAIYDELCQTSSTEKMTGAIEGIIRIRSVQDFSPSEAVSFVFLLKKAIREIGGSELDTLTRELNRFDLVIDDLALHTFDIYMKCREEIHDIRIKELKAGEQKALRLLQKMNIV